MIKALKDMWQAHRAPKVYLEADVDHLEVGGDFLILGLVLRWNNTQPQPLRIEEFQVTLYLQGRWKEGTRFYPHGHFTRVPGERTFKKTVGARQFVIPKGEHVENVRLMTRALLDLPPGEYLADFESTVAAGTFTHDSTLVIKPKARYRTAESWS